MGEYDVVITATDNSGESNNSNTQEFTITVTDTNVAPTFTSTPETTAIEDAEYSYTVKTQDVDAGDTVTLEGTTIPSWLNFNLTKDTWQKVGPDIDGEHDEDYSGYSVSLSDDGSTVAIGAIYNSGSTAEEEHIGHVRLYKWREYTEEDENNSIYYYLDRIQDNSQTKPIIITEPNPKYDDSEGDTSTPTNPKYIAPIVGNSYWTQVGADIDGEASGDESGYSVSLSSDGNTVAIGAILNDGDDLGHVRVYKYTNGTWTQVGADIDGEEHEDESGFSVSLSDDGSTVAISAVYNSGITAEGEYIGHVRIYKWREYTQEDANNSIYYYLDRRQDVTQPKPIIITEPNPIYDDFEGDEPTLMNPKYIAPIVGNSYWTQVGADIDGEAEYNNSGVSVSLSSDGNTVAIGANANDDNGDESGHVRIYKWREYTQEDANNSIYYYLDRRQDVTQPKPIIITKPNADYDEYETGDEDDDVSLTNPKYVAPIVGNSYWTQVGADIDGEAANDYSGWSVSLSSDGNTVAIGAPGDEGDGRGYAHIYQYTNGTWTQVGTNIVGKVYGDGFGGSVSLSGDGNTVAIGRTYIEHGDGYVRIYQNDNGTWTQVGDDIDGNMGEDGAHWISLSSDGNTVSIGYPDVGYVRVYNLRGKGPAPLTGTPTNDDVGNHHVVITAADSGGLYTKQEFTITVENTNDPPTITSTPETTAIEDTEYSYTVTTADVDVGDAVTLTGTLNGEALPTSWLTLTQEEKAWVQVGADIDGQAADDNSGWSVSLSGDGSTIAIGAPYNDGDTGDKYDDRGHVRVYQNVGGTWTQVGADIDGEDTGNNIGASISLSGDGSTVALQWAGDQDGHVRIYEYKIPTDAEWASGNLMKDGDEEQVIDKEYWTQVGADIIGNKSSNEDQQSSVSLSNDGNTVAIGAPGNNENDEDEFIGHVRIYQYSDNSWIQLGSDIDGESTGDSTGFSVSLSDDGSTVAIGAPENDGNRGHVRIYQYSDNSWIQLGSDIDGESTGDYSGGSVSLSGDGSTVAIGAPGNGGNGGNRGHVRIYQYSDNSWIQLGSDIDGEAADDWSGVSVSLSGDGNTVAIGADNNDGNTGDEDDNRGHVRIYQYSDNSWIQLGSDIDGEAADDWSGVSVSLSSDGNTVAIGADNNDGNTGDEDDNRGHVRVYNLHGKGPAALTGTPTNEHVGDNSIVLRATDSTGLYAEQTFTITVANTNDAPVVSDVTKTTDEDTAVEITLSGSDVDTGDTLTYSIVNVPSKGTLGAINGSTVVYTPSEHFNGEDTFTYKASDGVADSNTATVTINVNPVNDAPVISDVTATTDEDTAVEITLSGSDVDTGDTLTYSIVNVPSKGTLGAINGSTVVYTPSEHFNGEDTFTYKASDGVADSNTATVTITVNAVNDAPVISDVTATTDEDTAVEITLSGSDVDTGDTLTYSIVNVPSKGTLGAINGSTVVYTPSEHFNGEDTFTYKASDGVADSNTATVTITVNAVNDAPVVSDVTKTTDEDTAVEITLSGSDVDTGDTLTYSIVNVPSKGTLGAINGSTVVYTPSEHFNGEDTFTYKATDGVADSNTATVTITVNAVNDAPVVSDVTKATDEDTAVEITLSGSDVDTGDTLTYSIVNVPSRGTLGAINGSTVVYTPSEHFNGIDTFTYKASDGVADSNTATVTINVNPVNDAPVISDVTKTTDEDTAVEITLSGSDVDTGDTLTYSIVNVPSKGTLGAINGSTVVYTPSDNFNGIDTFTYKANDGVADSNTATVTINVNPVNDAPVISDVTKTTDEDTAVEITLSGSDVDTGDTLTYSIVNVPSKGTLGAINGSTVVYTPSDNFNGIDTFTYKANDGVADSNTATVTINVNPVNDAPVVSNITATTLEDTAVTIILSGSDVDTGDTLTYSIVNVPSKGTLGAINGSTVVYTPSDNFNGIDTFTYKANDGVADSNTATVTINVNPVNDAPLLVI